MGVSEHVDKTEAEWKGLKGLHSGAFHRAADTKLSAPLASPLGTVAPGAAPITIPGAIDWRDSSVVTPVKNQASCGSCWAFSSTETVESALGMAQLASGADVSIPILSPQQLVDCAPNPDHCGGSGGCEGSIQPLAFKYLIDAGGMDLESDYSYTARDGTCKDSKNKPRVAITGQVDIPTNDYNATINALVSVGPLAISVDASWSFYEGGVFSPSRSGIHTTIDHAVQLVGYGTEGGKDYWLVRNSWGSSWGEKGYIKLQKFGEGKEPCGIDKRPADGFGCDGGPSQITVCGTSGMLSGTSYVTGAHLI
jgi:cathepsin L